MTLPVIAALRVDTEMLLAPPPTLFAREPPFGFVGKVEKGVVAGNEGRFP